MGLEGCSGLAETGHHLVPKGAPHFGDDVVDNIIPICGNGSMGCHGKIENADPDARRLLGLRLLDEELSYLVGKLGGKPSAICWLARVSGITEEELYDLYH